MDSGEFEFASNISTDRIKAVSRLSVSHNGDTLEFFRCWTYSSGQLHSRPARGLRPDPANKETGGAAVEQAGWQGCPAVKLGPDAPAAGSRLSRNVNALADCNRRLGGEPVFPTAIIAPASREFVSR